MLIVGLVKVLLVRVSVVALPTKVSLLTAGRVSVLVPAIAVACTVVVPEVDPLNPNDADLVYDATQTNEKAWIWDVAEDVCPDGQQVVDWYHAVEHLDKAAVALYPNESDLPKRQRWLKTYKDHLYMGRIETIISVLHKRGVPQLATYFERHKRRMQYLEFRENGLPIGSGTVESGVKQFKQRLTGTGMRWHLPNANRMIILRAAILGHDFDNLWAKVA